VNNEQGTMNSCKIGFGVGMPLVGIHSCAKKHKAFTLLEVLISIMLLSLVLMALYRSADILRASNQNLFNHLERASDIIKGSNTLYMDIIQSNGDIDIKTDKEFHRLSINSTQHSLYGLSYAKVTWLVHKEQKSLLRLEGGEYELPLKLEQKVAIDKISTKMELFKIYKSKKKSELLVVMKILGNDAQSFMVQNIPQFTPPQKNNSRPKTPNLKNQPHQRDNNSSTILIL
jgi:prepilin-type N-terminal cleavage/methylation domain-containing protein